MLWSTASATGLLLLQDYSKTSICAQPITYTRVPVSLGCSCDGAGPAKQHPEHGSGQAHRDRHWAEGWGDTGPV